jgi:hypothetical protein
MKPWIAAAVLALTAWGASAQSNESLEVKSLQVISGAPVSSFTGEARNVAGRTIKSAVINFNLYDSDGNLVGNAQTQASNLEADAIWKFQSTPKVQFSTVKAVEVKAY